jgi:hypothetical protein
LGINNDELDPAPSVGTLIFCNVVIGIYILLYSIYA